MRASDPERLDEPWRSLAARYIAPDRVDAAERIGAGIETGTVYANRCDYLDPALAWTGVKDTGRGASLSPIGFEMLTRPKSYHLRHVL